MKKLKLVVFAGIMMMFLSSTVKAQGIEFFHGTFKEAQVKAKKEGKQIFIDIYATWCGPCKIMAKKYFTLKSVGKEFNKKFICLKVDAEKGAGVKMARKFAIRAYPTLIFTDANGKETKRIIGMQNEQQLLDLAK